MEQIAYVAKINKGDGKKNDRYNFFISLHGLFRFLNKLSQTPA